MNDPLLKCIPPLPVLTPLLPDHALAGRYGAALARLSAHGVKLKMPPYDTMCVSLIEEGVERFYIPGLKGARRRELYVHMQVPVTTKALQDKSVFINQPTTLWNTTCMDAMFDGIPQDLRKYATRAVFTEAADTLLSYSDPCLGPANTTRGHWFLTRELNQVATLGSVGIATLPRPYVHAWPRTFDEKQYLVQRLKSFHIDCRVFANLVKVPLWRLLTGNTYLYEKLHLSCRLLPFSGLLQCTALRAETFAAYKQRQLRRYEAYTRRGMLGIHHLQGLLNLVCATAYEAAPPALQAIFKHMPSIALQQADRRPWRGNQAGWRAALFAAHRKRPHLQMIDAGHMLAALEHIDGATETIMRYAPLRALAAYYAPQLAVIYARRLCRLAYPTSPSYSIAQMPTRNNFELYQTNLDQFYTYMARLAGASLV